jgi:hypothetical protein
MQVSALQRELKLDDQRKALLVVEQAIRVEASLSSWCSTN